MGAAIALKTFPNFLTWLMHIKTELLYEQLIDISVRMGLRTPLQVTLLDRLCSIILPF
jgi:hypothetical protein